MYSDFTDSYTEQRSCSTNSSDSDLIAICFNELGLSGYDAQLKETSFFMFEVLLTVCFVMLFIADTCSILGGTSLGVN